MSKKSADGWFAEYGESHRNRANKLIHWVCVPLIVASLIAMTWALPVPRLLQGIPFFNWAAVLLACSLAFYFRLSPSLAIGMVVYALLVVAGIVAYERYGSGPVWQVALILFVIAWIGQLIGHRIEGKKPSFFQDLQFLLIGPIWLLGFIYRRMGIRY